MCKIFVIDDEEIQLKLIKEILYEIFPNMDNKLIFVNNIDDANKFLDENNKTNIELAIVDYILKDKDNFTVTANKLIDKIKEKSNNKAVVLLITGYVDDPNIVGELMKVNADDIIKKPFTIAELVLRIKINLKRKNFSSFQNELLKLSRDFITQLKII